MRKQSRKKLQNNNNNNFEINLENNNIKKMNE